MKNPESDLNASISLVKELIDANTVTEFTRNVFEGILAKFENFTDLWKIYVKFAEKNYGLTSIRTKTIRRAIRYLPFDQHLMTQLLFDIHQASVASGSIEELRSAYTELSQRFSAQASQNLKIAEVYFKLLVNQTSRKSENPEFIEELEYLKATLDFFNKLFGDKKDLSFKDRNILANIYKSYIALILRLESTDVDKIMTTDVCERLVKIAGNEVDNWLLYIAFQKHVHDLNTREPIRAIYKRALRFCKGDTAKIYEDFKDYEILFGDNLEELTKIDELYKAVKNTETTETSKPHMGKQRVEIHNTIGDKKAQQLKSMSNIYEKQEKSELTVFIRGLPEGYDRSQILDLLPNVSLVYIARYCGRCSPHSSPREEVPQLLHRLPDRRRRY